MSLTCGYLSLNLTYDECLNFSSVNAFDNLFVVLGFSYIEIDLK